MKYPGARLFGARLSGARLFGACLFIAAALIHPAATLGAPTQEEVFRSISENISHGGNPSHSLALFCALLAIILLMVLIAYRTQSKATPKTQNHHGKLLKEVYKALGTKPRQRKRLHHLAHQTATRLGEPSLSPLTLMICKSMRSRR